MYGNVHILLDTGSGRPVPISPLMLETLHHRVSNALEDRFDALGEEMLKEIIWGYTKAIRVSKEVRRGRKTKPLREKLIRALKHKVQRNTSEVWLNVFELAAMDKATQGQGKGTETAGWFLFFEDGHEGRKHWSAKWQWVTLERAMRHAENAADMGNMKGPDRVQFLNKMKRVFAGRLGEGIMVRLDRPLFFEFPQYGMGPDGKSRASNVLGKYGHKGFEGWNVLAQVGGQFAQTGFRRINPMVDYRLLDIVKKTVRSVIERSV
jgi:hypothetical protein